MVELRRTVRFCLNATAPGSAPALDPATKRNGFSAWPAMRGLGRFYELEVCCRGEADPLTGYFINITVIDQAVRDTVVPYLTGLVAEESATAATPMGAVLRECLTLLNPALGGAVSRIALELSPFFSLSIRSAAMDRLTLRQQFEFSAAHRLHVPSLGDEENRRIFGKCNNPSGHGHNYRLEVAVRAPIGADGRVIDVEQLDALVDQAVVQKLDHKHLNVDVPAFKTLNPSVENIAIVIHGMLAPHVGRIGVELEEVSVWETPKTVCTYRGAGAVPIE